MKPVVVLGFDAASPRLIRDWALPAFARLRADGVTARTLNPPGLYVGAVWPSLITGVSPARHGRWCYDQFIPGSYGVRRMSPRDYQVEPFWMALDRAGKRVAIIDVPKSPSHALANGLHIADWGTHDPESRGFHTYPEALAHDVQRRYRTEPVGGCDSYGHDHDAVQQLCDRLIERAERKTELCLDLLARERWDLFFAVFTESHCAGHQLWRLHDPAHPEHDPVLRRALGDPLERVYRALDRSLARLLSALPTDATVVVLASHGMGPHYDGNMLLADMLAAMHVSGTRRDAVSTLQRTWHAAPAPLRRAINPLAVRAGLWLGRRRAGAPPGLGSALRTPDPTRMRYFAVPNNDCHGAIRLNIVGREPAGCVRTGGDVDDTIAALREELRTFVNEDTGRPVVASLHRIEDLYPGEPHGALPDLIIDWDRSAPIRRIVSTRYGRLERPPLTPRTGDHQPDGLLIARGPEIASGGDLDAMASVDLAPTICTILGLPRPDLDGHPIAAIVAPSKS